MTSAPSSGPDHVPREVGDAGGPGVADRSGYGLTVMVKVDVVFRMFW